MTECSKLAQRENQMKVEHKKSKFDQTKKWYMHNLESVLENETHKVLLNFEAQTDQLIPARRPYQVIINKKKKKRTLLSILADFNKIVVWMVSIRLLISKSSSPCTNPLVTVLRASITIGIAVTFLFHNFFLFFFFFFLFCSKAQVFNFLFAFFQFYSLVCLENKVHHSEGFLFVVGYH